MTSDPDPSSWLTSRALVHFLKARRDNNVKVELNGILVPIAQISYWPVADTYVLELVDGEDLRFALASDPRPDPDPGEDG